MGKGYKLFRLKKGQLYPLYVFADIPVKANEWLEAKCGMQDQNGKVKSKLGPLAYRPGWHINDKCPYVEHIYSIHEGKKYQKDGTVWCEVEYSDSISYQDEANENGKNKNDVIIARNAYLKHVPVNGYYRYKTSPSMYGEWIIAGKMKVIRVLDSEEVKQLCSEYDLKPLEVWNDKKNI